MRFALLVAAALAAVLALAAAPRAAEPPVFVAQNLSRTQIRSMPIEARPNRPIHFYGNAVRRRHHRAATPPPAPLRPAR
jgi:hypothetical protein